MLERQQTQLVCCVQELYQQLRTAGLWEQPLPDGADRHPPVHDILTALGLLNAKSDGSGELETFNHVRDSSEPDRDATPQSSDSVPETHGQRDGDIDQSKSPTLPCQYTISVSPRVSGLTDESRGSSMSLSPLDQSFERAPGLFGQEITQPNNAQWSSSQTQSKHGNPQAHVLDTLILPTDRGDFNTSNNLLQNNATNSSLFMEPLALGQSYSPLQAAALSTNQPSFCPGWAEIGVNFDSSDFSSDFHDPRPLVRTGTGIHASGQWQKHHAYV
jgi:hypothetical protein